MLLTLRIRLWRYAPVGWVVGAVLVVLAAARTMSPPPPATVPVLVAAHEIVAGASITAADLRVARVPRRTLPQGALTEPGEAVGTTTAVTVPQGLPLVPALLAGERFSIEPPEGSSVVPLDLVGAGALEVGDEVEVVPAGCEGAEPARAVVVETATDAAPVMLALAPQDAVRIVTIREICTLAAVLVE